MFLKSQIAKENTKMKKQQKLLNKKQKKAQTFDYEYLETREIELKFLTGVPNADLFEWVLKNLLKDGPLIVINKNASKIYKFCVLQADFFHGNLLEQFLFLL